MIAWKRGSLPSDTKSSTEPRNIHFSENLQVRKIMPRLCGSLLSCWSFQTVTTSQSQHLSIPPFFLLRKQEQLQLVFCHCRCLLCPLVLDNGARCSFAAAAQTIATMQIPPLLAPPDGFQGAVFAGAAKANLKPSKLLVSGMPGATVMAQLTVINELYPL